MKFSILTPTWNRREWLPRALESVLAQTHEDWELIVLDLSDEPISDLLPDDSRVRYFRQGRRQGPARDFQRCLELATGDVIHPLSDDDRLVPHALAYVSEHLGDRLWMYGRTEIVRANEEHVQLLGSPFSLDRLREGYYLGGAVYWRRALTDRIGGFDQRFDHAADYDLYLRFALDSMPLYSEEVLYLYTEHEATDTNQNMAVQQAVTEAIRSRWRHVPAGAPEVSPAPLSLEARSLAVLAHADEVLEDPGLLAAWGQAFGAEDDVSLVIYAPDGDTDLLAPPLVAACEAAGLGEERDPDLILLSVPGRQEGALARKVAAVLSEREPRGYLATVRHVGAAAAASLREPAPPSELPRRTAPHRPRRLRRQDMRLLTCLVADSGLDLTQETLESYFGAVQVPQFLVVVDNASEDGTAEYLAERAGVDLVITSPGLVSHGRACNVGWQEGLRRFEATHLHCPEAPVAYEPGWDLHALECMQAKPRLGRLELCGCDGSIGGAHVTRLALWGAGVRYAEEPPGVDGAIEERARFCGRVEALGWLCDEVASPLCSMLAKGSGSSRQARRPQAFRA